STRISCAVIVARTAAWNFGTSNDPSSRRNFIRLRLARLHAESFRNMYSEQGFDAWIRSVLITGFQSLIVVSYWIPGSPHAHSDSAIMRRRSFALCVAIVSAFVTARVVHSPSASTAFMKASVTRTELFEFWKKTESYAPPGTLNPPS